jgi:phytoene desaturase
MAKQVLIVGAGPGGLAAAVLLAKSGLKVKVIERMLTTGGRTSSHSAQGFTFDLGPTFFLYPRILDEVFKAAGTSLNKELELVRLDPQYRIAFGDGNNLDCTADVAAMEKQIAAISPGDAAGLRPFLDENRIKLEKMRPCLENPFLGWKDIFKLRLLKLLPMIRPHQSVDTYLRRFFKDERIRLAFCFQSKYLGMSPFKCPSLFSILSFLEYEYGVWHPIGGCSAVTKALARVATSMGVEISLGEEVQEVLLSGRRATGLRTNQGTYHADAIVINADFARAMEKLVPDSARRKWKNANLERKKYSCSTFMLYLGVDGTYDLPHHTIRVPTSYQQNLDDIENKQVLSQDPSLYVQNACVTDPGLAPKGKSAIYVLVPVPHITPNIDWAKETPALRERALQKVESLGFKDISKRILYQKILTPNDWLNRYEVYKGATFNLAHGLDQMLHLRPNNRFEDLDQVYLVGGGTHPGSGLPVIFESARISSRLLLEDLGITPDPSLSPSV